MSSEKKLNPWPWEIPSTWKWISICEVADVVGGGTPPTVDPANFEGGSIPWITPADLSGYNSKTISRGSRNITEKGLDSSGARVMPAGTVLLSSRAPIGYVAIAANSLATNQGFKSFVLSSNVFPDFVYYYLQYAKNILLSYASGTTFLELTGANAKKVPIPISPHGEQRRIVGEIEKQFTRLDAGVAALNRIRSNLKRYRAAVLKAACEGRLVATEAEVAKKEGRGYESASDLLVRILTERRQKWQGRGKYKEPGAPDTTNLPPLPDGWIVASLEQLTSATRPICYGILMPKENVATGVLYVKVKDMKGDKIDLESLHRTTFEIAAKYLRASLRTGDLLLSIRGTYGRVAVVPNELDGGNITQDTARLDVTGLVDHRYVATCLRNPDSQNYFKRVARGVAVKGVNIGDVRPTPVPLPPLAEQEWIVAEVERRLSVIGELESILEVNLKRAARLRQAILKRAFEGNLVPQDPKDEPASVLLERIKKERENQKSSMEAAKNRVKESRGVKTRGRKREGSGVR